MCASRSIDWGQSGRALRTVTRRRLHHRRKPHRHHEPQSWRHRESDQRVRIVGDAHHRSESGLVIKTSNCYSRCLLLTFGKRHCRNLFLYVYISFKRLNYSINCTALGFVLFWTFCFQYLGCMCFSKGQW